MIGYIVFGVAAAAAVAMLAYWGLKRATAGGRRFSRSMRQSLRQ